MSVKMLVFGMVYFIYSARASLWFGPCEINCKWFFLRGKNMSDVFSEIYFLSYIEYYAEAVEMSEA